MSYYVNKTGELNIHPDLPTELAKRIRDILEFSEGRGFGDDAAPSSPCPWRLSHYLDGYALYCDAYDSQSIEETIEWTEYLVEKVFADYEISGELTWSGEIETDVGIINVSASRITVTEGDEYLLSQVNPGSILSAVKEMNLITEISDEDLLAECKRRGLKID